MKSPEILINKTFKAFPLKDNGEQIKYVYEKLLI